MEFANVNPGKLWVRRADASNCIKPWAFGELPESRRDLYRLHSLNGRESICGGICEDLSCGLCQGKGYR